jgi:hypothetical protein
MEARKNLDTCIKDLLKEGPLVALYFSVGIDVLNDKIQSMSNEEIVEIFSKLLHPDRVRKNVKYLSDKLNER